MKEKELRVLPLKDDQIEIINEEQLFEFGGGDNTVLTNDTDVKTCGELTTCGWNSDTCPKLKTCDWN